MRYCGLLVVFLAGSHTGSEEGLREPRKRWATRGSVSRAVSRDESAAEQPNDDGGGGLGRSMLGVQGLINGSNR